jgi:hypothetical protein
MLSCLQDFDLDAKSFLHTLHIFCHKWEILIVWI